MFAICGLSDLRQGLLGFREVARFCSGHRHPVPDVVMALRTMMAFAARKQVVNVHRDFYLAPGLGTPVHAGVACSRLWCVQSHPDPVGREP